MKPHFGVAALAVTAATLVACGGGGGASPFVPPPYPQTVSASAGLSTSSTTPVALSTISNGSSATVTLPAASGTAKASLSLSATLPSGAVAPQAKSIAKAPDAIGASGITVLDYVVLSVDQPIIISQSPAFTFSLLNPVSGSAYIAFLDVAKASNGWKVILGPGTASGTTVSFKAQALVPSLSLQPNDVYVFALFTASGSVATPTPVPTYPGAVGSTFSFTGNQTQTDTYTYPSPSPLPSTSSSATLQGQYTVGASPFPSGTPATVDIHEVLTQAGSLASTVTNTDAWYGVVGGSAPGVALYGLTATDNAGPAPNTQTILYTTPNTVDLLPEANGATWSNSNAGTTNATFSDGETLARVDNADTSFKEVDTDTLSHHYTFELHGNADDSGSYSGTGFNAFGISSLNASAPANGTISVTVNLLPSSPRPSPTPIVIATPKAWFTAGTPLYKESDTETTAVNYPSACAVPASFGYQGTHIAQVIDKLDPMIGTHEHIVNDTYMSAVGPVCLVSSDTLTLNYDYLLDTATSYFNFADFTGTAVHVQTINEMLTLQSASLKSAAKSSSARSLSPLAVESARAHFALAVAHARHEIISGLIKHIEAKIAANNGGLK